MPETAVLLTPIHFVYLVGVIAILSVMILRIETPPVCVLFLFLMGFLGLGTVSGGIQTVFSAIIYAAREFMEVIATIALVAALSKCLTDLGSSRLLMAPMAGIMKTPTMAWWVLGVSMFLFSLFLWPSPSVALVGAILLPFAGKVGLSPLMAAMAMNLFGHGMALSYDLVVQGAPSVSAKAAGISAQDILQEGGPLFLVMGAVTAMADPGVLIKRKTESGEKKTIRCSYFHGIEQEKRRAALAAAFLTPLAFLADIVFLTVCDVKGSDATSLVSGTALLVMCISSAAAYGRNSFGKITGYVTDGFLFAIQIFAPVIVIGAFFFLGGGGLNTVLGKEISSGLMNDWALWLAEHAPVNRYGSLLIQMLAGGLGIFRTATDRSSGQNLWHSFRDVDSSACSCRTDYSSFYRRRNHHSLGTHPGCSDLQCRSSETGRKKSQAGIDWICCSFFGGMCTFVV